MRLLQSSVTTYRISTAILAAGALVALTIIISSSGQPTAIGTLASVSHSSFAGYLERATPTIIDVRTPQEFAAGHLPGAINIDFHHPNFRKKLAALDRNEEYAIYCRSGNRSGDTLTLMRTLGFRAVRDLSGGIESWRASGRNACTNC